MVTRLKQLTFLRAEPDPNADETGFAEQSYRIEVLDKSGDWRRIRATPRSGLNPVEGWVEAHKLFEPPSTPVDTRISEVAYLNLLTFMARASGHGLRFRDYLGAVAWLRSGIRNTVSDPLLGPIGPYQFMVDEWDELGDRFRLHLVAGQIFEPEAQASLATALSSKALVELTEFFEGMSRLLGEELARPNSADLFLANLLGLDPAKAVLKAGKLQTINEPLEDVYNDRNNTKDFVRSILDRHGDTMLEDGEPKTIEKVLADLVVKFDKAYAALKPHIDQLPDDLRTSPNAKGSMAALGTLSRKYETGGRGSETISTGKGDPGEQSYGLYQMTSANGGTVGDFVTSADFRWRDRFRGLTPGTADFNKVWTKLASEEPEAFALAQHAYIKRTHFDPLVQNLKDFGVDLTLGSRALLDVVWSTAVQHGTGNGASVLKKAIGNAGGAAALQLGDRESERKLIQAIYAERGRKEGGRLANFTRVTDPGLQKGLETRFANEERDALAMLDEAV